MQQWADEEHHDSPDGQDDELWVQHSAVGTFQIWTVAGPLGKGWLLSLSSVHALRKTK